MITPAHIQAYVESLTGHPLAQDEGVQHGDAERDVAVVTVAWMASPKAIRAARINQSDPVASHNASFEGTIPS